MKHCLLTCTFLLTASLPALSAEKADWPRFRGPKLDNLSPDKGLMQQWPKDGPPVVWKATGIGSGYSSITVAGDKVFTTGNRGRSSHIVALNRETGKELWTAEIGAEGGNLGSTPTVDRDHVYAIGQQGDLVCADIATGKVKWRINFQKDFKGNCGSWQYTESPLIDGDWLICTPGAKDAALVALDKLTGKVVWKANTPAKQNATAGYSSVVIAEVGGIKMYVQLTGCGVIGVAAKDGALLWHYDKLANTTANIPTPIVLGDHVFCAAGYDKGGALLKLSVNDGKVEAEEVYYNPHLKNKHGGLVIVGDYVFGDHNDSGRPFCAEVKSGKVMWDRGRVGAGGGSAAVTYADGRLYFVYDNGTAALVEASAKEYKETGTFKIPNPRGPSWAHPVVIGGRFYVRQSDTLWCYDVRAAKD